MPLFKTILLLFICYFMLLILPKNAFGMYAVWRETSNSPSYESICPEGWNIYCRDVNTNDTICRPGTVYTGDLSECQRNNFNYSNTCCTSSGGCDTPDRAHINLWDFRYAQYCQITGSQFGNVCDFSYTYITQTCGATDSCQYSPYLYAGSCNSACTGQTSCTGTQACSVGGRYKTCCYSNGTVDSDCIGGPFNGRCPGGTETVVCGVPSCAGISGYCTTASCGTPACEAIFPPASSAPPAAAFCGDNTCNSNETCSSCSGDCGLCPPSNCPSSGDNCVYSQGSECYSGRTSDTGSCTWVNGTCLNPAAGCTYSCGPVSCPQITSQPPPASTPPSGDGGCNFSACGANGSCGSDQKYVSGEQCWTNFNSWFRGDGCYTNSSCIPGPGGGGNAGISCISTSPVVAGSPATISITQQPARSDSSCYDNPATANIYLGGVWVGSCDAGCSDNGNSSDPANFSPPYCRMGWDQDSFGCENEGGTCNGTRSCTFTPNASGTYTAKVYYSGRTDPGCSAAPAQGSCVFSAITSTGNIDAAPNPCYGSNSNNGLCTEDTALATTPKLSWSTVNTSSATVCASINSSAFFPIWSAISFSGLPVRLSPAYTYVFNLYKGSSCSGTPLDSVTVTAIPAPPVLSGSTCPDPEGTPVTLNWNPSAGADYYWLRAADQKYGWDGLGCSDPNRLVKGSTCDNHYNSTSYSFSSAKNLSDVRGHTFNWWVHACNNTGCSGAGTTATASTITCPPAPPANPEVNCTGVNEAAFSWDYPFGATFYLNWLDNLTDSWDPSCRTYPYDVCLNVPFSPVNQNVQTNHGYKWRMKACNEALPNSSGAGSGGGCSPAAPDQLFSCNATLLPWIKTTVGDVHSNTGIRTPGGP